MSWAGFDRPLDLGTQTARGNPGGGGRCGCIASAARLCNLRVTRLQIGGVAVPSVPKLATLFLGLVSTLVVAADAAHRKFIREGMSEGEVVMKIGRPDSESTAPVWR
jgi:hypothetical protein